MADNGSSTWTNPKKRQKHTCPVPSCKKSVVHLPRHLTNTHKWSHEKALEAMSLFNLRARAKKTPCPVKGCRQSVADMHRHLKLRHNMREEEAQRTMSLKPKVQNKEVENATVKKREFKRRVCPYPNCNLVVRRIHNHLSDKHKLSRNDPRYREYLKSARFEELDEDLDPVSISSTSSSSHKESDAESEVDDDNNEEQNSAMTSSLSCDEEEALARLIRNKSERAKAIMRFGCKEADAKTTEMESSSTSSESRSSEPPRKTHKRQKTVVISSKDEDENENEENEQHIQDYEVGSDPGIVPPSPNTNKRRSIVFKQILNRIHDKEPPYLPTRRNTLPGEQSIPTVWNKTSGKTQLNTSEKETVKDKCSSSETSKITLEHPKRKMAATRGRLDSEAYSISSGNSYDDEEYKPTEESDESDEDEWEDEEELELDDNREASAAARGNSKTEQTLEEFKNWLQGIDGGRRELRTARQYVSQVSTIISYVDPINRNVSSLLNKKDIRDKWLAKMEKVKKPGTCKAYLGSLSRFLCFIIVERPRGLEASKDQASKVREQVQEWMCSFKAPLAERRWEKLREDFEKLIKPEDVQNFNKSEHARKAVSTLGQYMEKSAPPSPGQSDYCLVRDYLTTLLCIENACRAGPLSNMTLGELENAKQDGDQVVVTVMKHKNLISHGPAAVVLSPTVLKWLKAFVKYMRNKLPGAGANKQDRVFISWMAKPMSSSMISAQLNSCWHKAGGKRLDRVNAASFRKAAVSVVHEEHGHLKDDLADLMGHHTKTAEKFYRIRQKTKNAAKTSEALRKIMYTPRNGSERTKAVSSETSQTIISPGNQQGQELQISMAASKIDFEEEGVHEKSVAENSGETVTTRRHQWTEEENSAIADIFASDIQKKCITVERVKTKIEGHVLFGQMAPDKIVDKVRSLIRAQKGNKKAPAALPTETETTQQRVQRTLKDDDSESFFTSDVSKKGGMTFTDDQTEIYWRLFRDLIESNARVDRQTVSKRIQEDDEAREAIVGFTPQQLCDKIRTERRKIARNAVKREAACRRC